MNVDLKWGQVRAQLRADHKHGQHVIDVIVNGAARPHTLIARAVLEQQPGWGSKRGRMLGGWHFAQVIGSRRVIGLAYRTDSGLPVAPSMLQAPAYAWWPQHRERVPNGS